MHRTWIILTALLLVLTMNGFATPLALPTIAADSAVNNVEAYFTTAWIYDPPEDTFTNSQVNGHKWWKASMENKPDGTRAPVAGLALTLDSTLSFDHFQKENLTTTGPPTYEWSFGDVPEQSSAGVWVDSGRDSNYFPVTFTPGFDCSRSADKTEFSEPGTQTLTITLTPREATEGFGILIQAYEDNRVNSVITSPTRGDGIQLSPDGHSLNMHPTHLELNSTWTITVTIQVTPKASKVIFMPHVLIGWDEAGASGNTSGSFISHPVGDPVDEAGTWTWRAEGSYEWNWREALSRRVSWPSYSVGEDSTAVALEEGNHVHVDFLTCYVYEIPGDALTNGEVTGKMDWHTRIVNIQDETGAVVKDLKVTLTNPDNGALINEWAYGDVPEEGRTDLPWTPDAVLFGDIEHHPRTFTPGFDASLSIDKTVFTVPDTQTINITVTPRDERIIDRLSIEVVVPRDDIDIYDGGVISHTGEGDVYILPDGEVFEIRRENLELDTPWSITVTIQVTPKVPKLEFRPRIDIGCAGLRGGESSGTTTGSSVSYTNEAGTWTVSAEGDYVWNWQAASPSGCSALWTRKKLLWDTTSEGEEIWEIILLVSAIAVAAGLGIYFFRRRRRRVV